MYQKMAEAMEIFHKYEEDSMGLDAQHDILYSGVLVSVTELGDATRLKELGWHHDNEHDVWAIHI